MSSILKALKKVEDTQPEPRRTESWSHTFDSREAIRKQARRSRTVRTGMAVLCVAVALSVGGWWLYGAGRQPGGGGGEANPEGKAAPGSTGTESASPAESRASGAAASKPAPASAEKPESVEKASQPARAAAAVPVAGKIQPGRPEEGPAASKPTASPPRPSPSSAVAASGEPDIEEDLDTSRFRLEAIVWSNNPESRFAVINGNILRQGATMDGLTVTAIERNSVKLRSGNKAGEIRFDVD